MKVYLHLTFLIILLNLFSCKEPTRKIKVVETEKETVIKKVDSISTESNIDTKKILPQKHFEYFFVSAKSGLNYRDKPKGKVLGKYPLNTRLKVIENPKILDQITDNDKVLKGEWLGVENQKDTVYVFNAFLSSNYTYSDIKIYRTSPFLKGKNGKTKTAFLNLSESYFTESYYNNEDSEKLLLSENELSDTIKLNPKQRKRFLDRINVSEVDSVYIYDINSESISAYKVKNLPVIICDNIYGIDYEIGFDLGNSYNAGWENFTFVGNDNPFQKGKLKPIIWREIDTDSAIANFKKLKNHFPVLDKTSFSNFYEYKHDDMYYLLNISRLIVIDKKEKRIVFDKTFQEGEGSSLTMPKMENDTTNNSSQWTGKLFKNKHSIVFGFQYFSFGCESIDFLTETEPSIRILCDNRH